MIAVRRPDGLRLLYTSQLRGTVRTTRSSGKTTWPNPINTNQMFSHFHFVAYFIGTTEQPIMMPAKIISQRPTRIVNGMITLSVSISFLFLFYLDPICTSYSKNG